MKQLKECSLRTFKLYETGKDVPRTPLSMMTEAYNEVMQTLKIKICEKGLNNFMTVLENRDKARQGVITKADFKAALEAELTLVIPDFVSGSSRCWPPPQTHLKSTCEHALPGVPRPYPCFGTPPVALSP